MCLRDRYRWLGATVLGISKAFRAYYILSNFHVHPLLHALECTHAHKHTHVPM